MPRDDLLQHAASATADFYELLALAAHPAPTPDEIRRAYRRAARLYHPDKLGAGEYDADKFHLLQVAHDVLGDPAAREAYDARREAMARRQREGARLEGRRRTMKEELERAEREGAGAGAGAGFKRRRREDEDSERDQLEREVRRLEEDGRRRRREREERLRSEMEAGAAAAAAAAATTTTTTSGGRDRPVPEPRPSAAAAEAGDEEEALEEARVRELERRIADAEATKAARKAAKKKARKSGVLATEAADVRAEDVDAPGASSLKSAAGATAREEMAERGPDTTPLRNPAEEKRMRMDASLGGAAKGSFGTPKFSFSPAAAAAAAGGGKTEDDGSRSDFAATMQRLKERERQRLEDEIRLKEASEKAGEA